MCVEAMGPTYVHVFFLGLGGSFVSHTLQGCGGGGGTPDNPLPSFVPIKAVARMCRHLAKV